MACNGLHKIPWNHSFGTCKLSIPSEFLSSLFNDNTGWDSRKVIPRHKGNRVFSLLTFQVILVQRVTKEMADTVKIKSSMHTIIFLIVLSLAPQIFGIIWVFFTVISVMILQLAQLIKSWYKIDVEEWFSPVDSQQIFNNLNFLILISLFGICYIFWKCLHMFQLWVCFSFSSE